MKQAVKKPKEPSVFLDPKYVEPWFIARDRPLVTYCLIAANILAFFGVCIATRSIGFEFKPQEVISAGSNWAALTLKGQYWRLFTAC